MSKPLLTADAAYQKIQEYYNANGSKINIKELFDNDPKRFDKFSLVLKTPNDGDILLVSTSFIYNLLKLLHLHKSTDNLRHPITFNFHLFLIIGLLKESHY